MNACYLDNGVGGFSLFELLFHHQAALFPVVQHLRMLHVGRGKYVHFCTAGNIILQNAGRSVFGLDLAAR